MKNNQKFLVALILLFTFYLLFLVGRYWYADTLYNKGKIANTGEKPEMGADYLQNAIKISPREPLYHNEIAKSYVLTGNAESALSESQKAIDLSPANVNLKRSRFSYLIMFAADDPAHLIPAGEVLTSAISQAPTDAKLYYNLGLVYARTGSIDEAISILEKTIELKANYRDARLALAYLLIDKGEKLQAKEHLEYVLQYIDPNDSLAQQALESVK